MSSVFLDSLPHPSLPRRLRARRMPKHPGRGRMTLKYSMARYESSKPELCAGQKHFLIPSKVLAAQVGLRNCPHRDRWEGLHFWSSSSSNSGWNAPQKLILCFPQKYKSFYFNHSHRHIVIIIKLINDDIEHICNVLAIGHACTYFCNLYA